MRNKNVGTPQEVIVFGKNSNIGSEIVEHLKDRRINVRAFGSRECDFLNRAKCRAFFRKLPPKAYSIVLLSVVSKWLRNDRSAFFDNISLVGNFIEAQAQINVRQIIYFSSVDVYGAAPALPISERTDIDPDTWFGLAKYCCEWEFSHSPLVQCPVTILRIPGAYGNPHNDRSAIGKFLKGILNNGRVEIYGSGSTQRDYIHTRDIARVIELLVEKPYKGTLNLTTGCSYSLSRIVDTMKRSAGRRFEIVHKPPERQRDFDLKFDVSRLKGVFPGLRFISLKKGIGLYLERIGSKERM